MAEGLLSDEMACFHWLIEEAMAVSFTEKEECQHGQGIISYQLRPLPVLRFQYWRNCHMVW
jgi:hypothetical protein